MEGGRASDEKYRVRNRNLFMTLSNAHEQNGFLHLLTLCETLAAKSQCEVS